MVCRHCIAFLLLALTSVGCCNQPKHCLPVDLQRACCLLNFRPVDRWTPPHSCQSCPYHDRHSCSWHAPWKRRPCFCPPGQHEGKIDSVWEEIPVEHAAQAPTKSFEKAARAPDADRRAAADQKNESPSYQGEPLGRVGSF